jgi:mono/diheme cytochrome c family protein
MRCVKALALSAGAVIAGAAVFVASGVYDISATSPHWPVTRFVLELTRERSVETHSAGVELPDLKDPKLPEAGALLFRETCRLCHGAPGHPREKFAEGLYPNPPDPTSAEFQENSDAELYWIMGHGLKMTGMPAFSPAYAPKQLEGVLVLLRRLPKLSPQEFDVLAAPAAGEGLGGSPGVPSGSGSGSEPITPAEGK